MDDAVARRQAIDVKRSYIVRAPAGSGKTELLVQRLMAALLTVEDPSQVVAITFTRKAAHEMRSRIVSTLTQARDDMAIHGDHQRQTRQLAKQVLAHSERHHWTLLEQPECLQLMTIDALAHQIAHETPGLSSDWIHCELTPIPQLLYRQAIDHYLLDDHHEGPDRDRLCLMFDDFPERLQTACCHLLASRDQWLLPLLNQHSETPSNTLPTTTMATLVNLYLATLKDDLTPLENNPDCQALWLYRLQDISRQSNGTTQVDPANPRYTSLPQPGEINSQTLPRWQILAELLLTQSGETRKTFNRRQSVYPASAAGLLAEEKDARQAIKALAHRCRDHLINHPRAQEALAIVQRLPAGEGSQEDADLLATLRAALPAMLAELRLLMQEKQQIDYIEVTLQAIAAVRADQDNADGHLFWTQRIRHLLIDEFQDTSVSQYHLLRHLTSSWPDFDHHSLLLVGDPMQSIYRFRQAEVGLFHHCQTKGLGRITLEPLTLTRNFRSDPRLITRYNQAFSQLMGDRACLFTSRVAHENSVGINQNASSHWQGHALEDGNWEDVLDCCYHQLKHWQQTGLRQIAVLTRTRQQGASIEQYLHQQGESVHGHGTYHAADVAAIQDAITVTLMLCRGDDPIHNLALLRCPCLALPWQDCNLLMHQAPNDTLMMLKRHRSLALASTSHSQIDAFLPYLETAFEHMGHQPLADIWLWLWHNSGLYAHYHEAHDQTLLAAYHKGLSSYAPFEGPRDADDLLSRLQPHITEQAYSPHETVIQVMTIHQAKGLEFDAVVVVGEDRLAPPRSLPLVWSCPLTLDGQQHLLHPTRRLSDDMSNTHHAFIHHLEKEREKQEQWRLLYVALTRAKQHCAIIARTKSRNDDAETSSGPGLPPPQSVLGASWEILVAAGMEIESWPCCHQSQNIGHAQTTTHAPQTLIRLSPPSSINIAPHSHAPLYIDTSDKARRYGELLHAACQDIGQCYLPIDAWDTRLNSDDGLRSFSDALLQRQAIPFNERPELLTKLMHDLKRMWQDPIGHWLLTTRDGAYSELKIPDAHEETSWLRIDRTFIDRKKRRWLVDFKTGVYQPSDRQPSPNETMVEKRSIVARHQTQLERYRQAVLAHLDDQHPIVMAIYTTHDNTLYYWLPDDPSCHDQRRCIPDV